MEWSDYVMERVAAARLGELRAQSEPSGCSDVWDRRGAGPGRPSAGP